MKFNRAGVSIIEFIVGFGIFLVVAGALYALMTSSLKILNDDQQRSAALGIARKRMEYIKNLPYDDVGTVNGVPSGALQQNETEVLNNVTYTITTKIQYIDDSFDDVAPTDTVNIDYKKVRIKVSWPQGGEDDPVTLVTNIVPTQIESTATGGTVWIEVYDPTTDPIEPLKNASVTIDAPNVNPPVSTSGETDADGRFILPGLPEGIEAYKIVVTKPAYSTDQTYDRDPVTNPNPTPPHLNVVAGEVTTEYFEISKKVNLLAVHVRNYDTGDHLVVPFRLHGDKTIGTDTDGFPIYKYDVVHTPNNGGNAEIQALESDVYSILFDEADIGYVVAGHDHLLPYAALPQSSETIIIYLAQYEPFTALLTVINQAGDIVAGADVQLVHQPSGYNLTQPTTTYGQTFFRDLTTANYDVTITAAGYTTYTGSVIVNGNEQQTIPITAN